MEIYDITKSYLISNPDLTRGRIRKEYREKILHATSHVEEIGHYETVKEYPNGSKDVVWVIDVPGAEAQPQRTEKEEISVYIPYTAKEIADIEIAKLKTEIAAVDYKQFKRLRGELSDSEWIRVLEYIRTRTMRINELEKKCIIYMSF